MKENQAMESFIRILTTPASPPDSNCVLQHKGLSWPHGEQRTLGVGVVFKILSTVPTTVYVLCKPLEGPIVYERIIGGPRYRPRNSRIIITGNPI